MWDWLEIKCDPSRQAPWSLKPPHAPLKLQHVSPAWDGQHYQSAAKILMALAYHLIPFLWHSFGRYKIKRKREKTSCKRPRVHLHQHLSLIPPHITTRTLLLLDFCGRDCLHKSLAPFYVDTHLSCSSLTCFIFIIWPINHLISALSSWNLHHWSTDCSYPKKASVEESSDTRLSDPFLWEAIYILPKGCISWWNQSNVGMWEGVKLKPHAIASASVNTSVSILNVLNAHLHLYPYPYITMTIAIFHKISFEIYNFLLTECTHDRIHSVPIYIIVWIIEILPENSYDLSKNPIG